MAPDADVVVVGAGVVGLACAARLARAGRRVLLLERGAGIARETSSRNSEVIHAGLHHPRGSLKATLCVEGREALYARCARLAIPHRRLGKLVVAVDEEEVAALERLLRQGLDNGVRDLEMLDSRAVALREPALRAVAALWSPSSGIVDASALCLSFAAEAEAHGAVIALRTEVLGIEPRPGGFRVAARDAAGELAHLSAAQVVNAAGLEADRVAALAGIDPDARGYRIHPCKGDYFAVAPGAPLRLAHLVYPLPRGAGLGIHATPDRAGRLRLGPDAEYVERPHYGVDAAKAGLFAREVRRYLPGIEAAWLSPDFAGVRPRLAGPGEGFRDFVVADEGAAGLPGLVSCIGIESPGLTAAPAIAARVAALLAG